MSTSPTVQVFVVDPSGSEDRLYTFDFSAFPEIAAGATIVSATMTQSASSSAAAAQTVGAPTVSSNGQQVQVEISGGTAGIIYTHYCRATLTSGKKITCRGKLQVPGLGLG